MDILLFSLYNGIHYWAANINIPSKEKMTLLKSVLYLEPYIYIVQCCNTCRDTEVSSEHASLGTGCNLVVLVWFITWANMLFLSWTCKSTWSTVPNNQNLYTVAGPPATHLQAACCEWCQVNLFCPTPAQPAGVPHSLLWKGLGGLFSSLQLL